MKPEEEHIDHQTERAELQGFGEMVSYEILQVPERMFLSFHERRVLPAPQEGEDVGDGKQQTEYDSHEEEAPGRVVLVQGVDEQVLSQSPCKNTRDVREDHAPG